MNIESMSSRHDARHIARGFDPAEKIHEFYGCFTLKQAKKSLFGSTRFHHTPVYLSDEEEGVNLPIVIDTARAVIRNNGIQDVEMPDWYFEGWVLDPGTPGVQRVRIYVHTMDYDKEISADDIFEWQMVVDEPAEASGKPVRGWRKWMHDTANGFRLYLNQRNMY